jgi:small subunit ribosomal protein S17
MTVSAQNSSKARVLQGIVRSDKMDKGIVVSVQYYKQDPRVGKFMRTFKKFHAHDENNISKEGDTVEIQECRPYSKTKTWRLVKVIETKK